MATAELALTLAQGLGQAGTVMAVAGLAWAAWAAWHLRAAGTSLRPAGQPQVLVEEGPYRYGRNPMALGLGLVLAGLPLALGLPLLALAGLAYLALMHKVRIPAEEQRLRQHFGGWYVDYTQQVRRWL